MICQICKVESTKKGKTLVTLQKGESILLIKEVPAIICENCGHYYLESKTAQKVLSTGNEAISKGMELGILKKPA